MEKVRADWALRHVVASATDIGYQPGDKSLVWREKVVYNCIDEWIGPFNVLWLETETKNLYVQEAKAVN